MDRHYFYVTFQEVADDAPKGDLLNWLEGSLSIPEKEVSAVQPINDSQSPRELNDVG